jgi:hypothetical protein
MYIDGYGWKRYSSGGLEQEGNASFQVDVQTFTANGTWTKPTGMPFKTGKCYSMGSECEAVGQGHLYATAIVAKGGGVMVVDYTLIECF